MYKIVRQIGSFPPGSGMKRKIIELPPPRDSSWPSSRSRVISFWWYRLWQVHVPSTQPKRWNHKRWCLNIQKKGDMKSSPKLPSPRSSLQASVMAQTNSWANKHRVAIQALGRFGEANSSAGGQLDMCLFLAEDKEKNSFTFRPKKKSHCPVVHGPACQRKCHCCFCVTSK